MSANQPWIISITIFHARLFFYSRMPHVYAYKAWYIMSLTYNINEETGYQIQILVYQIAKSNFCCTELIFIYMFPKPIFFFYKVNNSLLSLNVFIVFNSIWWYVGNMYIFCFVLLKSCHIYDVSAPYKNLWISKLMRHSYLRKLPCSLFIQIQIFILTCMAAAKIPLSSTTKAEYIYSGSGCFWYSFCILHLFAHRIISVTWTIETNMTEWQIA